jgi:hypothetical protein
MSFNAPDINQFKVVGSTVGDLYFPQTKLLLPFDGTNGATSTTDSSNSNHTVTFNGTTQISTAQSKFGGSSLYVPNSATQGVYANGAGSTIQLTGDFTIEWWVYRVQVTLANGMVLGPIYGMQGGTNIGGYGMVFPYYYSPVSTSEGQVYASSNGSSWDIANGTTLGTGSLGTVGQWVHMAMVRSGTTWSYYVDGTRTYTGTLGSGTISTSTGTYMHLGRAWGNGGTSAEGYYDDFRITQGQARYTGASFTVPTTAHLTSAGDVNKQILINSTADGVAIGTGGVNQARIAKAWCRFDGSAAAASMIDDSYNVSSMTDNGTGDYSINFSTAMTNADYTAFGSVGSGAVDTYVGTLMRPQIYSTASFRFKMGYTHSTPYDYSENSVLIFGN